jgi:hypothetical protein
MNRVPSSVSAALIAAALLLGTVSGARAGVVVPTQHNDNFRTGANLAETALTPATVSQQGLRRVDRAVDGAINTQILYAHGVSAGGRERNVAYVTTAANSVYAFDADDRSQAPQGGFLWRRTLADPNASPPAIARGINATPVLEFADGKSTIDVLYSTANQFPWNSVGIGDELLMLKSLDVHYYLVKLDLATGTTVAGPVEVQGSMTRTDGRMMTFAARNESDTASLLLDHGYLYASFSARQNENVSQYYGWMVRYDASNLSYAGAFNTVPYAWAWQPATHPSPVPVSSDFVCYQPVGGRLEWWRTDWLVPNVPVQMACVGEGGGIWQGGAGPAADSDGNVYVMIGNGHYEPGLGSYGDSVVKLHSNGPGTTADAFGVTAWYSPSNERDQDETYDVDLGSAGPMVVDGAKRRVVAGGKTGIFYVVDDKLAHVQSIVAGVDHRVPDPTGHRRYQTWNLGPHLHGSPTFWRMSDRKGYVYEWAEKDYLKKYEFDIANGRFFVHNPVFHPWVARETAVLAAPCDKFLCLNAMPGGMLAVSANGTNESSGIVWAILRQYDLFSSDSLYAFDARKLELLWHDPIGAVPHFAGPTVADGHVFVPTNSVQWRFTIYSLGSGALPAATKTRPAARAWPPPAIAKQLAMARMMPPHMVSTKGGVPDYATDPVFRARLHLPKLTKSLPPGTIVGGAYGVIGNEVYDCTSSTCTRTRTDVLHVNRYDDRPGTAPGGEIPHAACSYAKTLAEVSPFGKAADWQLVAFAPNQCPVFGSATSFVERTWTLAGAPPAKAAPGEHVVPFTALYVALQPGK